MWYGRTVAHFCICTSCSRPSITSSMKPFTLIWDAQSSRARTAQPTYAAFVLQKQYLSSCGKDSMVNLSEAFWILFFQLGGNLCQIIYFAAFEWIIGQSSTSYEWCTCFGKGCSLTNDLSEVYTGNQQWAVSCIDYSVSSCLHHRHYRRLTTTHSLCERRQ